MKGHDSLKSHLYKKLIFDSSLGHLQMGRREEIWSKHKWTNLCWGHLANKNSLNAQGLWIRGGVGL